RVHDRLPRGGTRPLRAGRLHALLARGRPEDRRGGGRAPRARRAAHARGRAALSREDLVLDRLRANLRAVAIPATDEDLERLEADGVLRRVVENREVLAASGADDLPDFLGPWGPDPEDAAVGADGAEAPAPGRAATAPATPHAPTEVVAHPSGGSGIPDTIVGISDLLRRKEISPVELAERAIAQAGERDGELNLCQVLLPERALEAARAAEREIADGRWRGPLHGVPVGVKGLLEMRGTVTTAGSKVRAGRESAVDAAAVAHLEAAGAVIVGKTRLSEFAYWPGSTNPHFGPTRNPHDPQRDAGGSSSGSAAAVAAGVVYAALGTDTGGSIRIPAALCGTVGLKPTFGRASLAGCVPLAWSLDHIGPLTRDVRD